MGITHNATQSLPSTGTYGDIACGPGQNKATIPKAVYDYNTVPVVTTAFDAVLLPLAHPATSVVILNKGATTMSVQPFGTDTINGSGSADTVSAASGQGVAVVYVCAKAGKWFTLRSS